MHFINSVNNFLKSTILCSHVKIGHNLGVRAEDGHSQSVYIPKDENNFGLTRLANH